MTDSKEQVKGEAEVQEMNPFHALRMDEDEEPDDEEMEEVDDMQILSARLGQRSPHNE